MLKLVVFEELKQIFRDPLVANQVIINKKNIVHMEFPENVQLVAYLFKRFSAKFTTKHHNNITKFTAIRAPSRKLQTYSFVAV